MRRMKTRQATKWTTILLTLLLTIYACSPLDQPTLPSTQIPATSTHQQTLTPAPPTDTSTATQTPLGCITQPGRVEAGKLESTNPAQEYFIYLPPCYDEKTDERYPALYLLHGQTYTYDQWIRLGAVDVIDDLILSGESMPFIIVFPDDRYWNLQAGLRQSFQSGPDRPYAVLSVEGLAPYWFEIEGSLFLSSKGNLLARAEAYYDQRITQRLILQPRVELNFAAQDVRENRIGSGLSDAELGLRLRYEIRREFAPYVGISWERRVGDTARFRRAAGEDAQGTSFVAGIRFWF